MDLRQRGLGRGLGALIAPAPAATPTVGPHPSGSPTDVFFHGGVQAAAEPLPAPPPSQAAPPDTERVAGELRMVPLDAISPNPRQPRREFVEEELEELAASIREVGVLQPVVVREVVPGRYELVMGERRWRASGLAGVEAVPAVVRTTTDDDLLRDALLENLHRSALNPLEEAAAYAQLLTDFGTTHEDLASRLGRSRSHISNTLRLLGLPPVVQRRVAAGILSAGHARALLTVEDAGQQEALATRIVAEGLSVRAVEELAAVGQPDDRSGQRASGRGSRGGAPQAAGVAAETAALLTDRLDTRVKVEVGRSKGRITIEFAGLEDLERIVSAITTR